MRRFSALALVVALTLGLVAPPATASAAAPPEGGTTASAAAPPEGGITVLVDGRPVGFDVPPFIRRGRVLVPLRAIAEALGFAVQWDSGERRVTLTTRGKVIRVWVDSTHVEVDGKGSTVDVAPTLSRDRVFVPLRFVAEQVHAQVDWDPGRATVDITSSPVQAARTTLMHSLTQSGSGVEQTMSGEVAVSAGASTRRFRITDFVTPKTVLQTAFDLSGGGAGTPLPRLATVQGSPAAAYYQDPDQGWLNYGGGDRLVHAFRQGKAALLPDPFTLQNALVLSSMNRGYPRQTATEAVGGTTAVKLDLGLGPEALADITRADMVYVGFPSMRPGVLFGYIGKGELIRNFTARAVQAELWVDPATMRALKFTYQLSGTGTLAGAAVAVSYSGAFAFTSGTAQADWPDLSRAGAPPGAATQLAQAGMNWLEAQSSKESALRGTLSVSAGGNTKVLDVSEWQVKDGLLLQAAEVQATGSPKPLPVLAVQGNTLYYQDPHQGWLNYGDLGQNDRLRADFEQGRVVLVPHPLFMGAVLLSTAVAMDTATTLGRETLQGTEAAKVDLGLLEEDWPVLLDQLQFGYVGPGAVAHLTRADSADATVWIDPATGAVLRYSYSFTGSGTLGGQTVPVTIKGDFTFTPGHQEVQWPDLSHARRVAP